MLYSGLYPLISSISLSLRQVMMSVPAMLFRADHDGSTAGDGSFTVNVYCDVVSNMLVEQVFHNPF